MQHDPRPAAVDAQEALRRLADEEAACERCPLHRDATRVVPGEGPAVARLMLVGEQPGDQEDRQGRPFVGPAGRLLDRALAEAEIARAAVFLTNAVKHFKHEQRGARRLHKKPDAGEVRACRWWLERELALVEPELVVALGATAARTLLGRVVTLARERGREIPLPDGRRGFVTIHPSAILRMPDPAARDGAFAGLVADLRSARDLAGAVS